MLNGHEPTVSRSSFAALVTCDALCCSGGDILALRVGHLASLVFGVNMHGRDRVEGRIIVQVEIIITLCFYPL